MENQILFHQFLDSFDQILNLNHSYIYKQARPNAENLKAAHKLHYQTQFFWQKFQFWKPSSRAIQGKILISLACEGFIEGICIKNFKFSCPETWERSHLYTKKFIILHLDSCTFNNFWCLIHVHYKILKLTIQINCVFVRYTWFYHWCRLGFLEIQIRGFLIL